MSVQGAGGQQGSALDHTTIEARADAEPWTHVYPHSGVCSRCLRDRDDLFWHRFDETFYCADVFRCEARYYIQGLRAERASQIGNRV